MLDFFVEVPVLQTTGFFVSLPVFNYDSALFYCVFPSGKQNKTKNTLVILTSEGIKSSEYEEF